jgi:hypothetical protein
MTEDNSIDEETWFRNFKKAVLKALALKWIKPSQAQAHLEGVGLSKTKITNLLKISKSSKIRKRRKKAKKVKPVDKSANIDDNALPDDDNDGDNDDNEGKYDHQKSIIDY